MTESVQEKMIVCLGISRQEGVRQLVGKEVLGDGSVGNWVRATSGFESEGVETDRVKFLVDKAEWRWEPLPDHEWEYKVGHVMAVPVAGLVPNHCQKENWLVPEDGRITPFANWPLGESVETAFASFLDSCEGGLFSDGCSSKLGKNDRVPPEVAESLGYSLLFIQVSNLVLEVWPEDDRHPKGRLRALFEHNGESYRIWVTHSEMEGKYLGEGNGPYVSEEPIPVEEEIDWDEFEWELDTIQVGNAYLALSLLPPFYIDNFCYKVVVGVIELPG